MSSKVLFTIIRGPRWSAIVLLLVMMAGVASSAPPHPNLILRAAAGEATLPYFLTHQDEVRARGVDRVDPRQGNETKGTLNGQALAPRYAGEFRVLAVLVDFDDNPASVDEPFFDSLVFGSVGRTVSDYYREVSYDLVQMASVDLPSDLGWRRAPQSYEYYTNGQNGTGAYPNNTQKLAEDLIEQIDPLVDFSVYDNDGDGEVDGLLIIHSGRGAEFGGGNDAIWSHKWNISAEYRDGVVLSSYTIQPEYLSSPGDQTIGVIAHELGHLFGLPDLYDIDYSSNGVGKWGLMSFGSWLGPQGRGESPAHLCAWSKIELGWMTPISVVEDTYSLEIANAEENSEAYKLWTSGEPGNEYFLVEYRRQSGYDSYLPNSGLLIWHIDDGQSGNSAEWYPGLATATHYRVALEQADGMFELEHKNDIGDAGDPFPGTFSRTSFNSNTVPSADAYSGEESPISIDNISLAGSVAYADLVVGYVGQDTSGTVVDPVSLPSRVTLSQNYPNPFNPTTTIGFTSDAAAHALVEVYNNLGQKVRTVWDGNVPAGETAVQFDGRSDGGGQLASGVYYYRIVVGDFEDTKKMVLVR